jgi:hypothetical protein
MSSLAKKAKGPAAVCKRALTIRMDSNGGSIGPNGKKIGKL